MSAAPGPLANAAAAERNGGPDVFLVAGEVSGDHLGAALMQALRLAAPQVRLRGVGGPAMTGQGLRSLFPMQDIAVMGFLPVIANLPRLLRRIRETADAIIAAPPDVLVIIDSPDFTHRVARRVRAVNPHLPIVDYVSPTVWAWRPGRARKMRAYVDHLLAVLPFEPQVHRDLGGPACTYVGHPLVERLQELRPDAQEAARREGQPPLLLVLPGSRRSEIARLMPVFGETLARLRDDIGGFEAVLPAVDHLASDIAAQTSSWPVRPQVVRGEAAKFAVFRQARAAIAASGTVTLELALAHIPSVVAYKVSKLEETIARRLVHAQHMALPNIVLGARAIPEFLQDEASPDRLAPALAAILREGQERLAQLAAFERIDALMQLEAGATPAARAARIVLDLARK